MNQKITIRSKIPAYLKRPNKGGLFIGFIYVLVFMSIFMLIIWQITETQINNSSTQIINERLSLIEEQMNMFDETNNESITDISSSIQFLDKEIRKLWDLSNKRNKVNIDKLLQESKNLQNSVNNIEKNINKNNNSLISMNEKIILISKDIERLNSSYEDMSDIDMRLQNINTQLMLLDDTVQALNVYKNQLNQTILEIQTQISASQETKIE